ncbi:Hypothetical predicted protein, partial [Olea europaea subsp. europaea]
FQKDPNVIMTNKYIVDVATDRRLEFNHPWSEVDYVFLLILPINHAQWMFYRLDIKNHKMYVYNSNYKTYCEKMVFVGVDPFVRVIPHLLFALGIWNRTSVDPGKDPIVMRVLLVDDTPYQQNG